MAKLKEHMTVIVAAVVAVMVVALGGFLGTAIAISSKPSTTEARAAAPHSGTSPYPAAKDGHAAPGAPANHAPAKPRTVMTPWEAASENLVAPAKVEDIPRFLKGTMIVELGLADGLLGSLPEFTATKDSVSAEFSLRGDAKNRQREYGLMLAQAIVSHVYATGLPVKSVAFTIKDSNGKLALTGSVGVNPMKKRPEGTWEQSANGTLQFIEWLRGNSPKDDAARTKAEDLAMIDGPWIK